MSINKGYPSGWGGQTLANTYNKLTIKWKYLYTTFGVATGFSKTQNFKEKW